MHKLRLRKVGEKAGGTASDSCELCPAGTYQDTQGESTCLQCPVGKYSSQLGATSFVYCTLCMPGTYAAVPGMGESANALRTPTPRRQDSKRRHSALSCSIAMYSLSGSTECSECPVGTYGDTAGKGCTKCPEGKSTNELKGQTVCIDCPPGYAQANVGAATCDECAIDLYSTGGALACTSVRDTSTLNVKGRLCARHLHHRR